MGEEELLEVLYYELKLGLGLGLGLRFAGERLTLLFLFYFSRKYIGLSFFGVVCCGEVSFMWDFNCCGAIHPSNCVIFKLV